MDKVVGLTEAQHYVGQLFIVDIVDARSCLRLEPPPVLFVPEGGVERVCV